MSAARILNHEQLLHILSFYSNPIAIYTNENIVIEMANHAMLSSWGKGPEVIGLTLSEALPEISNQPFLQMLKDVWTSGIDDIGKAIVADLMVDGRMQQFYFDYEYRAMKDEAGQVYAIMHTATDVTDKVMGLEALDTAREKERIFEREQVLNKELAATNEELAATNEELFVTNDELNHAQDSLKHLNAQLEARVGQRTELLSRSESRLRYLLSDAPVAIAVFQGRDLIIESANKKVLEAWGKTAEIIGQPLRIAVPELEGQDFLRILDDVFITGEAYHGYEVKAMLEHNGELQEVYSNFVYQPLKDEEGSTRSIMLAATLVSEQVVARHRVQQLNDELRAINEEFSESQDRLIMVNLSLRESETRLDQILSELPSPVVVLLGPDQIIATTNKSLLQFWDRTREEVQGRPMLEVFPELTNQPFPALWKHVLETGERITHREKPVVFKNRKNGEDKLFYVNYYYQPLTDLNGERIGVLATVIDVTDNVRARRKVEEAEAQLRLAIDSSDLGTWYIDALSREFIPSPRLKQIFGFYGDQDMPYTAALEQVLDDYRDKVKTAVDEAIDNGENYDMEYPIRGFHDGQIRWVRATGKLYTGDEIGKANFSGTVQDITQRKLEEQRKDDFLSIASHELKTPVTSLKGAIQLLHRYKLNLASPIIPRLIDQANISVEKITNLLDDLLNTTRTNEGQLHLNKTSFNIAEMLDACCNHVRIGGKHDLILQGDKSLEIVADEARIDQVVVNFVNNAAKYAPSSREIYLIVEDLKDYAKISVKDNGPGIPAEKAPHLFERYYRADYSGAQYSGLGLGLYISAEIIKRHGGEIGVDSEMGAGSTFWFTIPIER